MNYKKIDQLITEILDHLSTLTLKNQEFIRFVWQLDAQTAFPGLSWLSVQESYPQFYWYQRTGAEECSALGMVKSFDSIDKAQAFLSQYPDIPEMRLWGLNGWNAVGDGDP